MAQLCKEDHWIMVVHNLLVLNLLKWWQRRSWLDLMNLLEPWVCADSTGISAGCRDEGMCSRLCPLPTRSVPESGWDCRTLLWSSETRDCWSDGVHTPLHLYIKCCIKTFGTCWSLLFLLTPSLWAWTPPGQGSDHPGLVSKPCLHLP